MLPKALDPHYSTPIPVVFQIVGYKNSGKTTLITKLIHRLKTAGYLVGTVKHDAHEFDIDKPGTDTWRHQQAGADITAISSTSRSAIISRRAESLPGLLAHMNHVEVILVEGFKEAKYPKLILLRTQEDAELLQLANPLMAVLWPQAAGVQITDGIPAYGIQDEEAIAACLLTELQQ